MEQNKNMPFEKLKVSNGIEIVFWVKDTNVNGKLVKMLKPSITKGWKNDKGEWENRVIGLNTNDLFRLVAMGTKIKDIEERFKTMRDAGQLS